MRSGDQRSGLTSVRELSFCQSCMGREQKDCVGSRKRLDDVSRSTG